MIRQKMVFVFADTEEKKIEFTKWLATKPKNVNAHYLN